MTSQIDAYFQKKVQHRPATDDIRCWWDRVIQWIGPFLLLVGFIAMILHVNVAVRCSVNGDIDLKALGTNASSLQSTTLPNADFVNAQCSSQLGFPTKSFSGILIALACILTLIGNLWFRLPITKSKMKTFKSRTDGSIKSSGTQEEIQRMISDPGSTPVPDAYDDLKKQHEELWQYRQCLEKKRFLGRFYLAKSVVQLVFSVLALVFSVFFAGWPSMHQGLFHCTLANVRADYVCTRTLGTWFIILNVIYAIAAALYIAILVFGIVWYLKEGRKPYGLDENADKITGRQKSTNKPQEQVVIEMEGGHNAAYEGGNDEPVPRRPPDGEAETSSSGSEGDGIAEVHSSEHELEVCVESDSLLVKQRDVPKEVDTFQGDAAFMVRLLERNKSEEAEHVTRMMSRPLKEMLEGVVFDPDEIRIHHETIEDDDTVTVNLEWNGPLKGEYSGFRITVEKRTDGNFVADNTVHVVKAEVGKERERTACLRHLERGSVYKVRILTVLEKEEGVIRTSQPSKIVIATKPPEPRLFVLKKSSGRFARNDRRLTLTGMVDKGNVTSFVLQYSIYSTHASTSGTHSKTTTKSRAIPDVITGKETDIQVRDLLPGTLYRFMLKCRCDYSKMETEERPINMDASHTESDFVEITVLTNPGEVKKVELQKERMPKLDTTTSVPIRWVKPKGSVDRYTVFYRGSQDEVFRQVLSHKESCILYGLTPGTEYTVIVAAECCTDNELCEYPPAEGIQESAESNYIQGKKVQADITLYTHPAKPTEMAADSTCTSIDVTWAKPLGQVQLYLVSWSDGSGDTGLKEVPCDTCTYTINYLQPGTKYTISVQAKSNGIFSEKEIMSKVTVPDSAVDVNISEVGDDTSKVRVTWGRLQGRVDSYSVICMDRAIQRECYRREIRTVKSQDDHSVELQGLVPGRYYEVCITAFSWDVQGRREDFQFSIKPNPPKRLRLDDEPGMDRSAFEWEPPVGDVEEYVLRINQKDSDHCLGDHVTTATRFSVNDLSPGSIYVCFVTSYSQGKESVPSCITFITAPVPPEEIQLELRDDTSVFVTWRSPSVGLYDGYTARCYSCETGDTIMEVKSNLEKAEFCELFPGTKYKFSVESCSNGRFSQPAEKHYLIRPGKPVVLKQEKFDTRTILLQWCPPHGKVNQYVVKYTGFGEDCQETMTTEDAGITLCNLNPGTRYSGDIIARVFDDGRHFDGLVEHWTAVTDPDWIGDCDVMHLTLKSVQLSWRRPDGQVNHFRVSYWPRGKAYRSKYVEIRETCKVLTGLDPGTRYEAQITSVSNGRESDSYQMQFDTGPDVALDFAEAGKGSTHVDLKWNIPHGSFEFFIVRWRSQDEAGLYESTETTKTHHTVDGLCPGDRYEVSVVTVSNEMESEPCFIYVQTDPAPIADIDIEPCIDAIKCKWSKPKGKVDGYLLQLKGPKDLQTGKTLPPIEVEEVEIPGLTPGTTYLGCLFTVRNNQRSESYCFSCSTRPAKCTPECSDKGTRSLKITWEPAEGEIRYYEIQLIRDHESVRIKKVPRDNDTETAFDELLPGTKYEVIIRTVTDNADTASDPLNVYTDPDEVGDIEVQTQERSATLCWEPPSGNWESFRVSHWKYKKQDKIDEYTHECVFALVDLEPGEKNYVEITTLVNSIESKERTTTFVTVPAMVSKEKIHVTEEIKSFKLTWDRPVGQVDGYDILVKQEDNESYKPNFKTPKPNALINKITPGVSYIIEIRSFSVENHSEPCCIHLQKSPAPPTLQRGGVIATKNTITLSWDLPKGKFERYQIFCKKDVTDKKDGIDTGTCYDLSAGKTYVINDLQPSTHYIGWIRTLSRGELESEHVNFDCFTEPEPPQHFTCLKDLRETTTLTLKWGASRGDIEGYTLIVRDTVGKETFHELKPNITRYLVKNLTPGMMYHCLISSTSQAGVKSSYVECQTSTVPEVPKAEFITISFREGAYVVCWERPRGVFKHMSFEYFPTDSEKDLKTLTSKESPSPPLSVTSGTIYVLHAFSVTDHDKSDQCVLKFTTAPTKPVLCDQMDIETRSVSISWEPVQALCSYEVSCRQAGINAMNPERTTECRYKLMNLLPATKYDVKLASCVKDNKGELLKSDTSNCTIWTNPSAPTNFKQIWSQVNKKRQPTSVKLKWEMPREDIDHFEIVYDAQGVGRSPVNVECSLETAEIVGLEPGTEYNCSISAFLSSGQKSECATCKAFTAPAMPGTIVTGTLVASNKGLYLQWMPAAGAVHNYIIMYRSAQVTVTDNQDDGSADTQTKLLLQGSNNDEPASEKNLEILDNDEEKARDASYEQTETVQSKCNLERLVPGTNYEIRIFAITHGYPSLPQQLTQATKPGKPGEVTKKEQTTSAESISLSWGASEGNVSGYEIEYGREDRTTRQPLSSSTPNCIIDNISPGVPYSYKVYAISNGMRGDPSQFVAATDPKRFTHTLSTFAVGCTAIYCGSFLVIHGEISTF
ncbi:tenascin-X [Lingula anatina]|uniref:Tenascin-X n=1 Tax=Lingula anatina TaxID=7574 RepID=A0A1S3JBZ5_LINAN|nr:tenascin-X [Lingula anatina]|eukprot:XP_013407927.1 tenascin-X [Lingula anatina]